MSAAVRILAAASRRLRLAALTFIALFAVKVAAAALSPDAPPAAGAAIVQSGDQVQPGNT
ncbi:MAG: hypothetical protein ACLFQ5_11920 [Oceanicaulis sp.]